MLRIVSHEPFCGQKTAIEDNEDIVNNSQVFERMDARIKIAQTDIGRKLQAEADALRDLLAAYKAGASRRTTRGNKISLLSKPPLVSYRQKDRRERPAPPGSGKSRRPRHEKGTRNHVEKCRIL